MSRRAPGKSPERDGRSILQVAGFPLKRQWNAVHLGNKILSLPTHAFLDDLRQSGAPLAY